MDRAFAVMRRHAPVGRPRRNSGARRDCALVCTAYIVGLNHQNRLAYAHFAATRCHTGIEGCIHILQIADHADLQILRLKQHRFDRLVARTHKRKVCLSGQRMIVKTNSAEHVVVEPRLALRIGDNERGTTEE